MDPQIASVGSTLLAVVLATAALHKLVHTRDFLRALAGYQLLPPVLVPAIATALPVLELAAAAMLVIEASRAVGGVASALLFGIYALAMGINLLRGHRDLACGCGWSADPAQPAPRISIGLVARNLMLIVMALALAFGHPDRPSNPVDTLNGAFGGVLAALLWATLDRLVANRRRMSPGYTP